MASLNVHAPDGKTLTVQVPEGTDPAHYGSLADDALSHYKSNGQMGGSPPLGFVAKQVMNMTPMAHPVRNLPLLGAMVGSTFGNPGVGAAAGAGTAQIIKDMAGIASGDPNAPRTAGDAAMSAGGQALGAGIAQEPQVLGQIPGVSKVTDLASGLMTKMGKGATKAMQALSGGKAGDFMEGAKKGFSTYTAPSKAEAGAMMGDALKKLPGESIAPTMAEHIATAITPESSAGNKFLVDLGKKIDQGELIDARQALKAKQSLDAVIDTVPIWQTKRRANLFDLKSTFDEILSSQSGELKNASNQYRAAVLKDNLTKFLPVNKHGEYSRLAPMLASLGSSVGAAAGIHKNGAEGGVIGGLTPLATMVALSPGVLGAGAVGAGAAGQAINSIAQNPAARQALMQVLQRITQKKQKS